MLDIEAPAAGGSSVTAESPEAFHSRPLANLEIMKRSRQNHVPFSNDPFWKRFGYHLLNFSGGRLLLLYCCLLCICTSLSQAA